MIDPIDLNPNHLATVKAILAEHVPECEVRAFGSRATWTAKDYSDLDLAVVGEGDMDWQTLGRLKEAFEESDLPMRVDVLDWHTISDGFRKVIERDYVTLWYGEKQTTENKWRRHDVSALIDEKVLVIGDGYRAKNTELSREGIPFARAGNIKDGFQFSDADHFPKDQLHKVGEKISRSGDTVFTSKGTVGRFAFVTDDTPRFVYSPQLSFWRSLNPTVLEPRFLHYWMTGREFFAQYKSVAGQTDMAEYVSLRDQRRMSITLPPPTEQRAIAHVLGTLDDKIELNRRMNETLEQIARTLFKSWFVDFDPVRAKMEGRWRRGDSLPGLPADLYDLFPNRLVDSELGEIPEGWEEKTLSDCIDLARGLSYKGSGLASTGIPMHNLNSIYEGGGYKEHGIKYYNGNFQDRHVTQPGDVLVANTEQGHDRLLIGFAAIVPKYLGDEGLFSHHLYRVQPNRSSALSADYVCQLLNTPSMHGTIGGYATGTTVNMLPVDALRLPSIVVPPIRLVTTFTRVAEAARERQYSLLIECQTLAAQRDGLLPRLVSGEMKVGEVT